MQKYKENRNHVSYISEEMLIMCKLERIEKIIRFHYWNDDCKHESYERCCCVIVSEIMKETGYQPRVTLGKEC